MIRVKSPWSVSLKNISYPTQRKPGIFPDSLLWKSCAAAYMASGTGFLAHHYSVCSILKLAQWPLVQVDWGDATSFLDVLLFPVWKPFPVGLALWCCNGTALWPWGLPHPHNKNCAAVWVLCLACVMQQHHPDLGCCKTLHGTWLLLWLGLQPTYCSQSFVLISIRSFVPQIWIQASTLVLVRCFLISWLMPLCNTH